MHLALTVGTLGCERIELPFVDWMLNHVWRSEDAPAMAAYEEVLALRADHAEALDRLAHLRFVRGDNRRGAKLAKAAAHLGFTDVFDAWSARYYDSKAVRGRPPRTTAAHFVQLGTE